MEKYQKGATVLVLQWLDKLRQNIARIENVDLVATSNFSSAKSKSEVRKAGAYLESSGSKFSRIVFYNVSNGR